MSKFVFRKARAGLTSERPGEWSVQDSSVSCTCPDCGKIHSLAGHSITEKGHISPSLICSRCSWHAHARLEEWSGQ